MAVMTEAEATALDELLTRTTPSVNPSVRGITARKGFGMIACEPAPEYLADVDVNASPKRQPKHTTGTR